MSEIKAADFEPPLANVQRIIKSVLPDNVTMTKETRAAIARAAGIFIFYITHGANDFSRESKRSTIYPQDIINSLKELGFEDFEEPLEEFLDAFRREAEEQKASKVPAEQDLVMETDEINYTEDETDGRPGK